MSIVLNGMHGLIKIVFGERSILATKWMQGIKAFKIDRTRLRANMAQGNEMVYKLDLHIQRWIEQCNNVEDREFVNDEAILCFNLIVSDAVMGNLNGSLLKVIQDLLEEDDDEVDGTKRGKRKNGKNDTRNNTNDNSEVVMNRDQIVEFKLGANEQYSKLISGKCVKDRVKWDNEGCMMCVRWHIGRRCVKHCKHATSHVPCASKSSAQRTEDEYDRFREEDAGAGHVTNQVGF